MSLSLPLSKPKASLDLITASARKAWLAKHGDTTSFPDFFVLAVRAYYSATIAPPGNNLSAYDDAFFIVSPLGFTSWNGNTDPSRYGWNSNAGKYMARLKPGCYKFIHRMHRGRYWAFGQGDNDVTVQRIRQDGTIALEETGCFGIDDHPGGITTTSSEGCVTHPPSQWDAYHTRLLDTMKSLRLTEYDFILIDGPIN